MTLVQNRPLPLNGNKTVIGSLCLIMICSSCGLFKPKDPVYEHKEGGFKTTVKPKSSKTDTIKWNKIPEKDKPPIRTDKPYDPTEEYVSTKQGNYKISLLLPFNHHKFQYSEEAVMEESNELRFVNYYAGVKLALDELERKGANLNVQVHDTKGSESTVSSLVRSNALSSSDLIIGPYKRDGLKSVAEYGKKNKITVVSPWQASSKITSENPHYIQMRPRLSKHYTKIVDHVLQNFSEDQVFLIGRSSDSDQKRFRSFQNAAAALSSSGSKRPFTEFTIVEDSLIYGDTAFDSIFHQNMPSVFILPNWSFKDEAFIYDCLRRINTEKGNNQVYVYGMPILLESDKISYDLYQQLNLRVCRSKFVDKNSNNVKNFRRSYFNTYGAMPKDDAYEGYDMMMFLGESLMKHGRNFQFELGKQRDNYLQTSFDVIRTYSKSSGDKFDLINYFENQSLDIIEFRNNRFQRSN